MEDTNFEGPNKGRIGIIRFILSRREGQQFLAATLFVIMVLSGFIIVLFGIIVKESNKIDELHVKNYDIKTEADDKLIQFWKEKNANDTRFTKEIDSVKAAKEIYILKKQMR